MKIFTVSLRVKTILLLGLGLLCVLAAASAAGNKLKKSPKTKNSNAPKIMTNQWHVELNKDNPSPEELSKLSRETGFTVVRRHLRSPNEFVLLHRAVPTASNRLSNGHHARLQAHPAVKQATQMEGYRRRKRGFREHSLPRVKKVGPSAVEYFRNNKKGLLSWTPSKEAWRGQERGRDMPNDPLFSKEWYIRNTGQAQGRPNLDLNVMAAWKQGITGKGITTAIMDDGIDYLHPDIAPNYNVESSFDFSSNDPYPYPRYTDDWFNSHGTRCAGEIVSVRDNHICGVGVAYGGRVAGLRMLDQPYMTDLIEAAAMSHDRDNIHIYSASWGPTDDGKTVDGPRNQTMRAIVEGVNKGRNGLGNIYVWASGDGGAADDCNCDGYAASMWTVSINSATNDGQTASYDESCSSTLASTFSNGKAWYSVDAGVGTVDLYGNCTLKHSGTSAAAPEAAAVFALALEANPSLTWRDLQHIVVLTSKRNHLHDPHARHNWTINGAGLEFNHLFGYGVLDAGDVALVSRNWKTVPARYHCIAGEFSGARVFNLSRALSLELQTDACQGQPQSEVNYLEHVQSFISLKASRRGDVNIFLTSPMGTTTMMLSSRRLDADSKQGFTNWPFMSTHMWGERARGKWRLLVTFDTQEALSHGVLTKWTLVLHGTQKQPYGALPDSLDKVVKKLAFIKREHQGSKFKH